MKNLYIISGLNLNDNNRGTAALGYGAFSFLTIEGLISPNDELLVIKGGRNLFKTKEKTETITIQGRDVICHTITVPSIYTYLARKYGILLPFTRLRKYFKRVKLVAAINGGDGFSDIYGDKWFYYRLPETTLAMKCKIPLIMLPQTIGPFEKEYNYQLAKRILQYSSKIYIRDDKYIEELKKIGVKFEQTKDLSAYMKPETWDIEIHPKSIGLNVSGLCYSNSFNNLEGQFESYPVLINNLIECFQKMGKIVYLIPHSYNYNHPEQFNDDIIACRQAYERLLKKDNVILIDRDLTSPQLKYIISKMTFFIGTRMHANFAAIYSHVPVFGLGYSYKFEGAFNANGLNGKEQTEMINYIKKTDIPVIIKKIENFYNKSILRNLKNE